MKPPRPSTDEELAGYRIKLESGSEVNPFRQRQIMARLDQEIHARKIAELALQILARQNNEGENQ